MVDTYLVNGSAFTSINAACTEIEATGDYADGIQDVIVSITTLDSTEVTVDAASAGTADASNYIRIEATSGARHDGTYNTGKQRLEVSGTGHAITVDEDFVHLKFLAVKQAGTQSSAECVRIQSGVTDLVIEKCVMYVNNTTQQDCIYMNQNATATIYDCALTASGTASRSCIHNQNTTGGTTTTYHIEHCTIDADGADTTGEAGIIGDEDTGQTAIMNIYNTIVFGTVSNGTDYLNLGSGSVAWTGQGNSSEDTSCQTQLGTTNNLDNVDVSVTDEAATEVLVTSLTAGSEDYQIIDGALSGNQMIDNWVTGGVRDSRLDLTIDCAGNARPVTDTDRDSGAFEVVTAAGSSIPIFMHYYRQRRT